MPIFKVRKLTSRGRETIRRALKRSWQPGGSHWARFLAGNAENDAETMRRRAAYDRRGLTVIAGVVKTEAGLQNLSIVHSLHGRCDQFDVTIGGVSVATCRAGKVLDAIMEAMT